MTNTEKRKERRILVADKGRGGNQRSIFNKGKKKKGGDGLILPSIMKKGRRVKKR